MKNKKSNGKLALILIILAVVVAITPFFLLKGAEFGGSDDAGSQMVAKIEGVKEYKPWFEPVLEKYIGGELPGEIESLLFCLQTGIGVGVLFFFIGRFYERSKWTRDEERDKE